MYVVYSHTFYISKLDNNNVLEILHSVIISNDSGVVSVFNEIEQSKEIIRMNLTISVHIK